MFSAEEYSQTIDSFINTMVQTTELDSLEAEKALTEMCDLLRIGRIETLQYETLWHEKMNYSRTEVVYDSGSADLERIIKNREIQGFDSVSYFLFCQREGEEDWSEEEQKKIATFRKLLLAFNERASSTRIAENLKYNDVQMGIRNIAYFMKKISTLISKHIIGDFGVCYFNIRRMSVINNQVGRDGGTAVMKSFIDGLQSMLVANECVCRVGGDMFVVLFTKTKLKKISEYLSGTEITESQSNKKFTVCASQGYYMVDPDECRMPTDIMEKASFAANLAKKSPDAAKVFYDEKVKETELQAKEIEKTFGTAIENEEFLVYYQPKVALEDYSITGAEALCRWFHEGEMIQPYRFIPVLEKNRLICELDFYMLEHVCRDIRRWLDEGKNAVKVSVNLSRMHLGDENLLEDVLSIIDRYGIPHEYIEIELTETTTEVDYSELKKIVKGLMAEGIYTSVDDFGVGYSSLNLIRELPWNVLKIDKSFLPDGSSDNDTQAKTVLRDVVGMAHDLGLQCIVEGVETPEQVTLLKENNCGIAQGFYFDKPMPVEEFETRLKDCK